MKRFAVLSVVLAPVVLVASVFAAEPSEPYWPQWRGPGRDAKSPDTGLLTSWEETKPRLLWMSEGMGEGYSSVSIADGHIYTTGNTGEGQAVVAASVADGKVAWTTKVTDEDPKHGYDGARCTPTIDGEHLYVVASSGKILCLKRANGEVVWSKDFQKEWDGRMMSGWGFSESPLVDGDKVVCTPGGRRALMVALDKKTGEEIWQSRVPNLEGKKEGAGYASIVISNGGGVKQYIQLVGKGVVSVRADNGEFLWAYTRVANPTANIPTCVVDGDYVFTSTGYGSGGAAGLKLSADGDGVKAEELYYMNSGTFQNHHGGMVLIDGFVYAGAKHGEGYPTCIELKSGEITWGADQRGPGKGSAAIVYADGHTIYRYQNGLVALIETNPDEYILKGSFMPEYQKGPSWAHPVVTGGRLFLREQDKLMCYDLHPQAAE